MNLDNVWENTSVTSKCWASGRNVLRAVTSQKRDTGRFSCWRQGGTERRGSTLGHRWGDAQGWRWPGKWCPQKPAVIRVTFSLPTCAPSAAASCLVGLVPCLFICSSTVFCFLIFKIFIYLFSAALGICGLVAVSRDCSLLAVHWLLIAVAFLAAEHRLWARRLQQLWLPGCRAQAQQLQHTDWAPPHTSKHVESSGIKYRTHVSCAGSGCFTTEPPGKPSSSGFYWASTLCQALCWRLRIEWGANLDEAPALKELTHPPDSQQAGLRLPQWRRWTTSFMKLPQRQV